MMLIIILVVGLLYEWYYGGLEWLVYVNGLDPRRIGCIDIRIMTSSVNDNRDQSNVFPTVGFVQVINKENVSSIFFRSKNRLIGYTMQGIIERL